jgi:mono/diheme cytochrome c family protein
MKKISKMISKLVGLPGAVIVIALAVLTWLVIGCSTEKQSTEVAAGTTAAPTGKSGAELWAENCVRCHNIRSPSSYSPAQWEVVMMHMRVRANLTPEEHKKILGFLKSGS